MLGITGLPGPGCAPPGPRGALTLSQGASALLDDLAAAYQRRSGDALLDLLTGDCLAREPGIDFVLRPQPGHHVVQWRRRAAAGTLARDLHAQLEGFARVDRARFFFAALDLQGERAARAEIAVAVDGTLTGGARRSDRGRLRVRLERGSDGAWKIASLDVRGLYSVVVTAPLWRDASTDLGDLRRAGDPVHGTGTDLEAARPGGLAVADLDGDGRLDVIVPGRGGVRIGLGRAGGRLGPAPPLPALPAGLDVRDVVAADLDADGDVDLLLLPTAADPVLLVNAGDARFTVRPGLSGAGAARAAVALDLDGDGRLDLVLAPDRGGPLTVHRGGPEGLRAAPAALPGLRPGPVAALCTGDLDGDGRPDLVVVERLGPVHVIASGARAPVAITGPLLGRGCAVTDLDGDGRLDLVLAAVHAREAWMYGQPGFTWPGAPLRVTARQIARLVEATAGSRWLRNEGGLQFASRPLADPSSLGWDAAVALVDPAASGQDDVVLLGGLAAGPGAARLDPALLGSALPRYLAGLPPGRVDPRRGALAPDRAPAWLVAPGAGEGQDLGASGGIAVDGPVTAAVAADLDRDGVPELLLRRAAGGLVLLRAAGRPTGHHLTVRLVAPGAVAAGATVVAVTLDRRRVVTLAGPGRAPDEVRLGLGAAARVDRLEIRWPDGSRQEVQDLAADRSYTIFKGRATPVPGLARAAAPPPGPTDEAPPPARGALPELERTGGVSAWPVQAPGPTTLGKLLGRTATVLLVAPGPCPTCAAITAAVAGPLAPLRARGVAFLHLSARGGPNVAPGWTAVAPTLETPLGTEVRLLVLGPDGRTVTAWMAALPDPLVLRQLVERLLDE